MAKILIIDDNRFNSEMLRDMIDSMGHEVVCAQSAAEGLALAQTQNIDVVFLDVQLPDGNGLLLLPSIHATPSAPEVIIITGFGSPDGAELAIKNGAWDFIEKPLERGLTDFSTASRSSVQRSKRTPKNTFGTEAGRHRRHEPRDGNLHGAHCSGSRQRRQCSHHRGIRNGERTFCASYP